MVSNNPLFFKKYAAEILFCIAVFVIIGIEVFIFICGPSADMRIDNEEVRMMNQDWRVDGYASPLPHRMRGESEATLTMVLPPMEVDSALCVEAYSENITAKIGDKQIYQYVMPGEGQYEFGAMWHCMRIPQEAAGQEITLLVQAQDFQGKSTTNYAVFGTKSAIVFYLFKQNIWACISSVCCFILGLFLIFANLIIQKRSVFIFLGAFSVVAAIWIITDTRLLQMFVGNQMLVFVLSFSTFMLLPIPFYFFLREVGNAKRAKMLNGFCILFAVQYLINICLYLLRAAPLSETVTITHIYLAVSGITSIVLFTKDAIKDRNRDAWYIGAGFFILAVAAALDIVRFYQNYNLNNSMFFRIGLLLFTLLFAVGAFIRNKRLVETNAKLNQNAMVMHFYISVLERQNDIAAQNVKKLSIFRHDLRHITNMALASMESGDTANAIKLLSSLDKNVQEVWLGAQAAPYSDHKILNTAITFYIGRARESGIDVSVHLDPIQNLRVDMTELAVVLANGLENAIHACNELPEGEKRMIRLSGHQHGGQFFLEIVNSCGVQVEFSPVTRLPVSERQGHGIGVQSIDFFAKRYDLVLEFFIKDGLFHMQLLI